jgi:Zn-dependent protease
MDYETIIKIISMLPVLIFSIIIHECAHGWMAERCGDDTARVMGRITLNPLPHIDLYGTILLPLVMFVLHMPFLFGYAKPVPINPYRFNRPRRDTILVSFAGPGSNLALAIGFSLIVRFAASSFTLSPLVTGMLMYAVIINVLLAVFNLIPIPPLDGSGIVSSLLPAEWAVRYERLRPYGFFILIFLFGSHLLDPLMNLLMSLFLHLFLGGINI